MKHRKDQYLEFVVALYNGVASVTLTHLVELLLMYAKVKGAVRLVLSPQEYNRALQLNIPSDIFISRSSKKYIPASSNSLGDNFYSTVEWDNPLGSTFPLYLSFDQKTAESGAQAENEQLSDQVLGSILQIPECCIENYSRIAKGEEWLNTWVEDCTDFGVYAHEVNHLSSYLSGCNLYGDYLPCSLQCQMTLNKAKESIQILKYFELNGLLEKVASYGSMPIVIIDNLILYFSDQKKLNTGERLSIPRNSILTFGKSDLLDTELFSLAAEIEFSSGFISLTASQKYNIGWTELFHKVLNFK